MTLPTTASSPTVRPDGEPLLRARDVSVGYDRVPVVHDLDLDVWRGEVVALLGPNGAGKSTTLLALCGELSPSAGTVEWLGRPVRTPLDRRCREGMGYVPEGRSVIFGLSTADNLRLGGDPEVALSLFPELKPLLKRRAGLLSGGEQQILSLARALSREPKLLLADELSLGLAPLVVKRLLDALRDAASRGVGVLLVEQQVRHALQHADYAYVLRRGRIVLESPAAEALANLDQIEASYLSPVTADNESRDA